MQDSAAYTGMITALSSSSGSDFQLNYSLGILDRQIAENLGSVYDNLPVVMIDAIVDYYIDSHYLPGSEHWSWPWGKSTVADELEEPGNAPELHQMLGAANGLIGSIGGLFGNSLDSALSIAQGWTRHDPGGASGGGGTGRGSDDDDSGSGAGATGGDAITTGNELSVDAGIVAPVANPPGTWSGGGTGTPDPGLPINPDYVGIQPIILDLDGDGVEVNAAANVDFDWDGASENANWARVA